jgi:hypothetical protein
VDYVDYGLGSPVNGLNYEDTVFDDCGIYYIGLAQNAFSTAQDEVRTNNLPWNQIEAYGLL